MAAPGGFGARRALGRRRSTVSRPRSALAAGPSLTEIRTKSATRRRETDAKVPAPTLGKPLRRSGPNACRSSQAARRRRYAHAPPIGISLSIPRDYMHGTGGSGPNSREGVQRADRRDREAAGPSRWPPSRGSTHLPATEDPHGGVNARAVCRPLLARTIEAGVIPDRLERR